MGQVLPEGLVVQSEASQVPPQLVVLVMEIVELADYHFDVGEVNCRSVDGMKSVDSSHSQLVLLDKAGDTLMTVSFQVEEV